jgi:hypothetical protein
MSIKSKVLAAAATLTLVGGVGAAGALTAGTAAAATPSCGASCIDIFSRDFGTHASPNFVVDVLRQGENVGQPIILFRTSNSDPAEDFTVSLQGFVSDFAAAGLVSPAVALHYGGGACAIPENDFVDPDVAGGAPEVAKGCEVFFPDLPAFELEYAPFGVDSGLCMGLAATAVANEGVTLQPCGVSAKTVWITDTNDSPATLANGYIPLINGSDTNFSHPFVLTYPAFGFPTDKPRPQLKVTNLTGFSHGFPPGPILSTVNSNQLWGADFGVLK